MNHKVLLKVLQTYTEFPQFSIGLKYIIIYIKHVCKENNQRRKEIWENFFKFLLKEFGQDFKQYYITLQLFQYYLKLATVEDLQYI